MPHEISNPQAAADAGEKIYQARYRVHYEDRGTGPALLLIPGALGSARTDFGPQLEELPAHFRVIAADPRGYGRSRPPERDFPLDFLERDAAGMAALAVSVGAPV